ncbi:hypothetical protein MRX96_014945 [Rhipicephalus microplus]
MKRCSQLQADAFEVGGGVEESSSRDQYTVAVDRSSRNEIQRSQEGRFRRNDGHLRRLRRLRLTFANGTCRIRVSWIRRPNNSTFRETHSFATYCAATSYGNDYANPREAYNSPDDSDTSHSTDKASAKTSVKAHAYYTAVYESSSAAWDHKAACTIYKDAFDFYKAYSAACSYYSAACSYYSATYAYYSATFPYYSAACTYYSTACTYYSAACTYYSAACTYYSAAYAYYSTAYAYYSAAYAYYKAADYYYYKADFDKANCGDINHYIHHHFNHCVSHWINNPRAM